MRETLAAFLLITLVADGISHWRRDNTDPPNGRSELRLYTDAGTGCQYVGTWLGSITPRLDAVGKPMCGKP